MPSPCLGEKLRQDTAMWQTGTPWLFLSALHNLAQRAQLHRCCFSPHRALRPLNVTGINSLLTWEMGCQEKHFSCWKVPQQLGALLPWIQESSPLPCPPGTRNSLQGHFLCLLGDHCGKVNNNEGFLFSCCLTQWSPLSYSNGSKGGLKF